MSLFDLSGRTALVTGSGQGMGLGVAEALAQQGARVAINDFYAGRAEAAAEGLRERGFEAMAVAGDITQAAVRTAMMQAIEARWRHLDILVHNAGVPPGMPQALRTLDHLGPADFEQQLDLNLRAIVELTRLALPGMRQAHHGRIVVISSESWRIGLSMGLSHYAAAKAAALGFMRHLAHETGKQGITVNALALGTMNNFGYDDIAKRTTAVGRAGTPADVGAAVAYLVSDEAAWMTGQTIALNGGALTA